MIAPEKGTARREIGRQMIVRFTLDSPAGSRHWSVGPATSSDCWQCETTQDTEVTKKSCSPARLCPSRSCQSCSSCPVCFLVLRVLRGFCSLCALCVLCGCFSPRIQNRPSQIGDRIRPTWAFSPTRAFLSIPLSFSTLRPIPALEKGPERPSFSQSRIFYVYPTTTLSPFVSSWFVFSPSSLRVLCALCGCFCLPIRPCAALCYTAPVRTTRQSRRAGNHSVHPVHPVGKPRQTNESGCF